MEAPRSQKKVQRLTGCMAALSRFISRLGEKGMPFYKPLKKVDKFQWTTEAHEALETLKKFLTTPPVLKPPCRAMSNQPAEDLLLYISCTTHMVSTTLVVEWVEEGHTCWGEGEDATLRSKPSPISLHQWRQNDRRGPPFVLYTAR
jgi:hypothetical protein